MRGRAVVVLVVVAVLLTAAGTGYAQRIVSGFYGTAPPRPPTATSFRGAFTFCRVWFASDRREKRGWGTDYPGADINFSIRLSELTKTRVTRQIDSNDPEFVVVRLSDPELFQCPYLLFEDAGTMRLSRPEAAAFHDYLLKGGFAFVSDYWGEYAREQFDEEMAVVLPPEKYRTIDLPIDHPLWHTHFQMTKIPQMPSIQSWRRTGGQTDRGVSDPVNARAIADEKGRLMVVMMHNTDIPDGWEREGEDPAYFYRFSPDAYTVGINVFLYAATH